MLFGAALVPSSSAGAAGSVVPALDHPHVIVSYTFVPGDNDCKGTQLCRAAPTETVAQGDAMTFTNLDSFVTFHTVDSDTPGLFSTGLIGIGANAIASFSTAHLAPGDYGYHCALHPVMRGTFTVVAPARRARP